MGCGRGDALPKCMGSAVYGPSGCTCGPSSVSNLIKANDAIEDRARALIVKVLLNAAKRDDPHGSFYELASDVSDARPADLPSWVALDAVILALGGRPA